MKARIWACDRRGLGVWYSISTKGISWGSVAYLGYLIILRIWLGVRTSHVLTLFCFVTTIVSVVSAIRPLLCCCGTALVLSMHGTLFESLQYPYKKLEEIAVFRPTESCCLFSAMNLFILPRFRSTSMAPRRKRKLKGAVLCDLGWV